MRNEPFIGGLELAADVRRLFVEHAQKRQSLQLQAAGKTWHGLAVEHLFKTGVKAVDVPMKGAARLKKTGFQIFQPLQIVQRGELLRTEVLELRLDEPDADLAVRMRLFAKVQRPGQRQQRPGIFRKAPAGRFFGKKSAERFRGQKSAVVDVFQKSRDNQYHKGFPRFRFGVFVKDLMQSGHHEPMHYFIFKKGKFFDFLSEAYPGVCRQRSAPGRTGKDDFPRLGNEASLQLAGLGQVINGPVLHAGPQLFKKRRIFLIFLNLGFPLCG